MTETEQQRHELRLPYFARPRAFPNCLLQIGVQLLAILDPISSIVGFSEESCGLERSSPTSSEDPKGVKFYHATTKEFIAGDPIGNENDRVFFINDVNKYFLGPRLLRFFNNSCERDVFGEPAILLPLGDKRKWDDFMERELHSPQHLRYTRPRRHLLKHLAARSFHFSIMNCDSFKLREKLKKNRA
ncbi:uncharacterized protein EI90DRAFT_3124129 [Cantharellus anzutake]|uniref:uncharacterized protein n=1 Tax=Cantharellus anzutake TaxID=1750568 RepID=UPI001908A5E5|nr:uncharacterized protein EI90DRAFT_3124129 [Cantharellus anzutake]KAF8330907.1 hypothetical protein EI90DRAFT_3124129 [Cantharellus anzutake]